MESGEISNLVHTWGPSNRSYIVLALANDKTGHSRLVQYNIGKTDYKQTWSIETLVHGVNYVLGQFGWWLFLMRPVISFASLISLL